MLVPACVCRAERQDDDQNFELDLILATIDCQDGPPKERVAAGRASVHTSQEVSSHRESDCSDDQRHRRGSMQVNLQIIPAPLFSASGLSFSFSGCRQNMIRSFWCVRSSRLGVFQVGCSGVYFYEHRAGINGQM